MSSSQVLEENTTAFDPAAALNELKHQLPAPPLPIGSYIAVTQVDNLLYTSGVLPMQDGQVVYVGPVGSWNVGVTQGQAAARLCLLNALSLIHHTLDGQLDRVKRIVKLTGFVSSTPTFYEQPAVMNGASDCLVEFFGEAGKHVRSAVGVISLPRNASVEVELVVEITP